MIAVDYFLTEEQQMIKDLAAQIAREKVRPLRAQLDESEEFPWDIIKDLAQSDLYGLYIPEEFGGMGGGILENCLAVEQLATACIGVATTFAASGLGAYPILIGGSEEQKRTYLLRSPPGKRLSLGRQAPAVTLRHSNHRVVMATITS
jgi:butyryl-CoA dehydrogenase